MCIRDSYVANFLKSCIGLLASILSGLLLAFVLSVPAVSYTHLLSCCIHFRKGHSKIRSLWIPPHFLQKEVQDVYKRQDQTLGVAGRAANGLDEAGLTAQKAFLVGIQDRHKADHTV